MIPCSQQQPQRTQWRLFSTSAPRKRKGDFFPNNQAKILSTTSSTSNNGIMNNNGKNVYQQFESKHSLHPLDEINNNNNVVTNKKTKKQRSYANNQDKLDSHSIAKWLKEEEDEDDHVIHTKTLPSKKKNHHDLISEFANQPADKLAIKELFLQRKVTLPSAITTSTKPSKKKQKKVTASTSTATTMVRAQVKETGQDTMSQYVKSMGQHELLSKDAEILLGTQIQILNEWEQQRQQFEQIHGR